MNFTIYSRDMCGYCEKVKEVMDLTNQEYVVFSSQNSSTGNASGHNMMIGARPDSTSEDCPTGTRIGAQAAWYGGDNSFVSGSSITAARNQFESIFAATKGRYS